MPSIEAYSCNILLASDIFLCPYILSKIEQTDGLSSLRTEQHEMGEIFV